MIGNDQQNQKTDEEVAGAAKELLERDHSMSLATLGQQLSKKFEMPLRAMLGPRRRLLPIIRAHLGDTIEISGAIGSERATLIVGDAEGDHSGGIRFDPAVWAAFAKPIASGKVRWIKTERPFTFDDIGPDILSSVGSRKIPPDLIPSESLPKPDRDNQIIKAIKTWCQDNDLQPTAFTVRKRAVEQKTNFNPAIIPEVSSKGLIALRSIVDAIPSAEQSQYSIPLNLLSRLLS